RATSAAQKLLKREFSRARLFKGEDAGMPILGAAGLAAFGNHVFAGKRMSWKITPPRVKDIHLLKSEWPALDAPLSLIVGKGGVGKTTISAALGFHARQKSRRAVEICSVDPAPSLDDVFETEVGDEPGIVLGDPRFRASEMDSVRIFQRWVEEIKAAIEEATTAERSGIHVDFWFERQLFSRLLEIVPPGIDEVFAIIRISDLLGDPSKRIVIDMAPTGHALDLLRTPERILAWTRLLLKTLAAHRTLGFARDAGVKVAELGQRVRELLEVLKDPKQTGIFTVVLPEPLPDRETERLVDDLDELGLRSKSMFINRVLFSRNTAGCLKCEQARRWQLATIARLELLKTPGRPRLAGSSKRPPPASGCRDCRIPRHIASPSGHSFSQRSISRGRHPRAKSSSGHGFAPYCRNARVGYQGLCITSTRGPTGKSEDGKGISSGQIEPPALTQTAGLERRGKKIRERTGTTRRCHRRTRQE